MACGHGVAASVAEVVVGDDAFDAGDAVLGEVGRGAGQERSAGGAFLVGQDLGVGQSGVVVDEGMDVVVADASSPDLFPAAAVARQPPPSGIRPIFLTSMWTSSPGRSRS